MLVFCACNCDEIELKRLVKELAVVSSCARAPESVALVDIACIWVKKVFSVPEIPVASFDSKVSAEPTWPRNAEVSASSAVLDCNWVSR